MSVAAQSSFKRVKLGQEGDGLAAIDWTDPAPQLCAHDCPLRSESDHRVSNHLAMLSSYVQLKARDLGKDEWVSDTSFRLFLQSIEAQIAAISKLHRLLTSVGTGAPVNLARLLHEVCAPFANGLTQRIVLIEDFEEGCLAAADQALPISQIVAEAIINSVKYAHPDGALGELRVRCLRDDEGVRIEVIDNGVGLPDTFDPSRDGGLGFQLMRGFGRDIRARLGFHSDAKGLRVSCELPLNAG